DEITGHVSVPAGDDGTTVLTQLMRRLDQRKIHITDLALRRPTLDDVFLNLTGHSAEADPTGAGERGDGEGPGPARRRGRKAKR
ncbi:MAG TPA: daunorubicin/doxorubicin resistance ABC transporter ATP-binding protein DrrA, partial [Actinomycetota bacterium]